MKNLDFTALMAVALRKRPHHAKAQAIKKAYVVLKFDCYFLVWVARYHALA